MLPSFPVDFQDRASHGVRLRQVGGRGDRRTSTLWLKSIHLSLKPASPSSPHISPSAGPDHGTLLPLPLLLLLGQKADVDSNLVFTIDFISVCRCFLNCKTVVVALGVLIGRIRDKKGPKVDLLLAHSNGSEGVRAPSASCRSPSLW